MNRVQNDNVIKPKEIPRGLTFFEQTSTMRKLRKALDEVLLDSVNELLNAAASHKGAEGTTAGGAPGAAAGAGGGS